MPLEDTVRDVLQEPFAQMHTLDSSGLCDFLQARDIWVTEEDLEIFEREGFLSPLFRLRRRRREDRSLEGFSNLPGFLRSYLNDGLIEFPAVGDFRPWSSFKEGYEQAVYLFYHPAQALTVESLLDVMRIPIMGLYRKDIRWERVGSQLTKRYELLKQAYLSSSSNMEKRVSLLIRLETPYLPLHWRRLGIDHLRDGESKDWLDWKKNAFKPADLLTRSGLSVDEVKAWRDALAVHAIHFDPLGNWYMLVRLVNYGRKTRLRGKALRAQDYYEHVSLLNLFLEDLTGERQREPYEIADASDGSWKKMIYGDDFDLDKLETQKKIFNEYLPYGERILTKLVLVVEGDSEEACIPALCHEILWAFERDAELINLGGTGNLRKLEPLLRWTREDRVKVHIIADPHPGVKELIEDLVRRRLLETNGYKMWQRDLEEDNFSEEDILEGANALLRHRNWAISGAELQSLSTSDKRVMERIREAVYRKYGVSLWDVLSKRALARILIEPRLKEIRQEVATGKYEARLELEKVLIQVSKRISFTHRSQAIT